MENLTNFFADNWEYITPLVLWFASRVIKTERNYDLVEMILKFLGDYIIPNRRANRSHKGGYPSGRGGINTGKFPLLLLIAIAPGFIPGPQTYAQLNGNFKSVRFVNAGSNEASIPTTAGNGAIYYNEGTQTFRAFQNGVWQDLIGTGGITTASNGLNVVGNDVRMGGTITETTTIDGTQRLTLSMDSIDIISANGDRLFLQSTGNYAFNLSTGVIAAFGGSPNGLAYAADYSANFGTLNLPNVGWVNSRLGSFLTGSLTGDALVNANGNSTSFLTNSSVLVQVNTAPNTINLVSPNSALSVNDLSVTANAPSNMTQILQGTGFSISDLNASLAIQTSGSDINMTSESGDLNLIGNSVIANAPSNLTTILSQFGFSISNLNATLSTNPSGFDINMTSEFGDLNINGDAINLTGRSVTAGVAPSEPITLTTGQQTALGDTGPVNILTGQSTSVDSGDINITTGIGGQNTGSIVLTTGNATNNSGIIQLATGSGGISAGGIEFEFGGTSNRIDFNGTQTSFNTLGTYTIDNPGGAISLQSETSMDLISNDDPGAGTTGPITLASGTSVSGNTGNIVIQTGTTSATRGSITLGTVVLLAPSLPTSSAGLPSGAIWNNAGVLNIVP